MQRNRRTIILRTRNARNLTVINDQVLCLGAGHDLVAINAFNRRTQRQEIRAPVAGRFLFAILVNIAAKVHVFTIPEGTDQRQLLVIRKQGTLILEPLLQTLTVFDKL